MQIEKVFEKLYIFNSNVMNLNATAIDCGNFFIVIDTFLLNKDTRIISDLIKNNNNYIKYLINTHWHSDHYMGNQYLYNLHSDNESLIIAHHKYIDTALSEKNMLNPKKTVSFSEEKIKHPNVILNEITTINFNPLYKTLDNISLEIFHTPGHTYDSISIFCRDKGILWSGDTILASDDMSFSLPYFYWGSPFDLLRTLNNILSLEVNSLISGHGSIYINQKDFIEKLIKFQILYIEELINQSKLIIKTVRNFEEFESLLNIEKLISFRHTHIKIDQTKQTIHKLNLKKLFEISINNTESI